MFALTVISIPIPSKTAFVFVASKTAHSESLYKDTFVVSLELRPMMLGVRSLLLGELGFVEEKLGSFGPELS